MFERPDYAEHIGDKRLEARVQRRYGEKIAALEALGFECRSVCSESARVSLRFFVRILLNQLRRRTAMSIALPGRITFYQPLLFHEAAGSYATAWAYGVMIASCFADNTVLISANAWSAWSDENYIHKVPEENFYYYGIRDSVAATWQAHQGRIDRLRAEGYRLKEPLNFEDYTHIQYRNLEVNIGIKGIRK